MWFRKKYILIYRAVETERNLNQMLQKFKREVILSIIPFFNNILTRFLRVRTTFTRNHKQYTLPEFILPTTRHKSKDGDFTKNDSYKKPVSCLLRLRIFSYCIEKISQLGRIY